MAHKLEAHTYAEQITDLLFHLELMSFSGWKCRLSQSELVENLAT
jgi:hypothetical protein